jgi:hypothetical protein
MVTWGLFDIIREIQGMPTSYELIATTGGTVIRPTEVNQIIFTNTSGILATGNVSNYSRIYKTRANNDFFNTVLLDTQEIIKRYIDLYN